MVKRKIQLSDVTKNYFKLLGYVTLSNGLGYLVATYIAKDPVLTAVFGPTINIVIWAIRQELKKEGYVEALKK